MKMETQKEMKDIKSQAGTNDSVQKQIKDKFGIDIDQWQFDADFMGFVTDEHSLNMVKDATSDLFKGAKLYQAPLKAVYHFLKQNGLPDIVLLDLSAENDLRAAAQALTAIDKKAHLVVIGRENEIELYRDLMEIGVADYLVKPVTAHETQRVINRIMDAKQAALMDEDQDLYEQILVMGCRGGVGTSTVATNLAWILSEELNNQTCLFDLDVHFGTAALLLDLQPCAGLRDALKKPERLDKLLLSSSASKMTKKLSVLALEESPNSELRVDPSAANMICNFLEEDNRFAVIDLPRTAIHLFEPMMKKASHLLLVSDLSLAGIRDTVRLKKLAKQHNPKMHVEIIINRHMDNHCHVQYKDFERGIGGKISYLIPDDPKAMAKSANAGVAIAKLDKRAKSAEAIRQIARGFSSAAKSKQKTGWLNKILKNVNKQDKGGQ